MVHTNSQQVLYLSSEREYIPQVSSPVDIFGVYDIGVNGDVISLGIDVNVVHELVGWGGVGVGVCVCVLYHQHKVKPSSCFALKRFNMDKLRDILHRIGGFGTYGRQCHETMPIVFAREKCAMT